MDRNESFIKEGLKQVRSALMVAMGRDNVHLKPGTISRAAAARLRSALSVLETLVRRLILLIAVELDLAPSAPARPGERKQASRTRGLRGFILIPVYRYDGVALDRLRGNSRAASCGEVSTAPLLHRWCTLTALLNAPERAAHRMARMLQRSRRENLPPPLCLPQPRRHRLHPELGLIAGLLPARVNRALRDWFDSG